MDAQETYAKLCAGCHGADAHGSQQGPGLAANANVRRQSVQNLRNLIRRGIPAAGMPPFDLPDAPLDAVVALIKSLNMPAADSSVPGDRAAGKLIFFGKGQCGSCHMVYGAGEPIGPDLSNVARELTVDMLRLVGFPDADRAWRSYPFELSGGLRQRAMIAMALVCRPALLIAAEPTTARGARGSTPVRATGGPPPAPRPRRAARAGREDRRSSR